MHATICERIIIVHVCMMTNNARVYVVDLMHRE